MICQKLLRKFDILVVRRNLDLMKFPVRFLSLSNASLKVVLDEKS